MLFVECGGLPPLLRRDVLHPTLIPEPALDQGSDQASGCPTRRLALSLEGICVWVLGSLVFSLTRVCHRRGSGLLRPMSARSQNCLGFSCLCAGTLQPPYKGARRSTPRFCGQSPSSQPREEQVFRVHAPALYGFRPNQARRGVLILVAHQQRIAVGQVRRDLAIVAQRDIRPFFSQLHAVSLVIELVRHQPRSRISPARHRGEQHQPPPEM